MRRDDVACTRVVVATCGWVVLPRWASRRKRQVSQAEGGAQRCRTGTRVPAISVAEHATQR